MTETKTHDDVINEEIEQEHAERKKEKNIEVIQMPEEECQKMNENLNDPNLFAMDAALCRPACTLLPQAGRCPRPG